MSKTKESHGGWLLVNCLLGFALLFLLARHFFPDKLILPTWFA